MKKAYIYKKLVAAIICAVTVVFAGCVKDSSDKYSAGGIQMVITLPASDNLTKANSTAPDLLINEIDILLFKNNGVNSPETFYKRISTSDILLDNNTSSNKREITINLQKVTGTPFRFVVFTNLSTVLDNANLYEGETKEDLYERLTFSNSSAWTPSKGLPMWGEAEHTYVIDKEGQNIGTIPLIRAVARVDVGLNMDSAYEPQGFGNLFRIENISIHNIADRGLAVPDKDNYTLVRGNPTTLTISDPSQAVSANMAKIYHTPDNFAGLMGGIYVCETDNHASLQGVNYACIIIKGYYTPQGESLNTTKPSYYRLDIYERDTEGNPYDTRQDILRNHRYIMNITEVNGHGHDTEEQALNSQTKNMELRVTVWEESTEFDYEIFNYYFELDREKIWILSDAGTDNELRIRTNVPVSALEATMKASSDINDAEDNSFISNIRLYQESSDVILVKFDNAGYPDDQERKHFMHFTTKNFTYILPAYQQYAFIDYYYFTPDLYQNILPVDGGPYIFTIGGLFPDMYVGYGTDLHYVTGGTEAVINYLNIPKSVRITGQDLYPNYYEIGYYNLSKVKKGDIVKQRQDVPYFTLTSTGARVATNYATLDGDYHSPHIGMTWTEAMGIDSKYNYELFQGVDGSGIYVPTEYTGCGIYAEKDMPVGNWKVPTKAELQEISNNVNQIRADYIYYEDTTWEANFWSASEWSTSNVYCLSYKQLPGSSGLVKASGTDSQHVYTLCVTY